MNLAVDNNFAEIWDRISAALEKELGAATHKSWIKPLETEVVGEDLILSAPTKFMQGWVEGHYLPKIKLLAGIHFKNVLLQHKSSAPVQMAEVQPEAVEKTVVQIERFTQNLTSRIDARFTFENYILSGSNELAAAAAKSVAQKAGQSGLNPLFLQSGVGLGKTHLMHAIANYNAEYHPERKIIYLSAEKFMHSFVRALRERTIMDFKEELRSADILMVDDFQFLVGKESTQEEFFHTLNALIEGGKQLVISSDRKPSEFAALPERMRARLSSGLVADIKAADYELRLRVLKSKLAMQPQVVVPNEVLEFLAQNISSNIRELEGALNRITARASLVHEEVDLQNTRSWLADLLKIKAQEFSIEQLQEMVSTYFGIKTEDMLSSARPQKIARPRQLAMWLTKKHTTKSLQEIGRRFGGKDHATVMHACKKVEELITLDAAFAKDAEALMAKLR